MSLDPRDHELLDKLLDGSASEAEQAELDQRSAASPELREALQRMRALLEACRQVPDRPVPGELTERLLADIQTLELATRPWGRRSQDRVSRKGGSTITLRWGDLAMRYAMAFSLGLVIAAGAYEAIFGDEQSLDLALLAGTMSQGAVTDASATERLPLAEANLSGEAALHRSGRLLVLELAVDARPGTELVLPLVGGVRVSGFASLSGDPEAISLDRGRLSIRPTEGAQRYAVFMPRGPQSVTLDILQEGSPVARHTLRVPRGS